MCCLGAVGKVRSEKSKSCWVEIKGVFEFMEEFRVRDGVVCFGEVEKDGGCGFLIINVLSDFIYDGF